MSWIDPSLLQVLSLTEKLHEEVGTLATSKANKSDVMDLRRSSISRHPTLFNAYFPYLFEALQPLIQQV
jgi:hypothetical protein